METTSPASHLLPARPQRRDDWLHHLVISRAAVRRHFCECLSEKSLISTDSCDHELSKEIGMQTEDKDIHFYPCTLKMNGSYNTNYDSALFELTMKPSDN